MIAGPARPPERHGHFMWTSTGRRFWPLDPRADEVDVLDIARGLAFECRYAGQSVSFYSVAEHSVTVSIMCEEIARQRGWSEDAIRAVARLGLMHDGTEAYIGDMIRPLKYEPEMQSFRAAEAVVEAAIVERFELTRHPAALDLVREVDNRILSDEIPQVMVVTGADIDEAYCKFGEPLGVTIQCLSPAEAEHLFVARYVELFLA